MNSSTETDALSAGIGVAGILVAVLIGVALYVFMSLALSRIFQKLGQPGWKAWVPVVNTITILELGGYSALWVIAAFIPLLNVVAVVIIILAVNQINVRLGKGGGYTALYVLLPAVWAGLLGFGRTGPTSASDAPVSRFAPVAAPTAVALPPAPFRQTAPPAPPLPPLPLTPPTPLTPPAAAATPGSAGAVSPEPFWVSAPPGVLPVVPAPARSQMDPPPAAPVLQPPTPPVLPPVQPPSRPPAPPVPTVLAPTVLAPIAGPVPDPSGDGDIESTRISTRRAKPWILETDDGHRTSLTRPVVLIGRNPAQSAAHPGAQLVSVADAGKTVSKTHARMELADGLWTISDLHSTNGVVVIDERGDERALAAGSDSLVTERFLLGELPARIFLES